MNETAYLHKWLWTSLHTFWVWFYGFALEVEPSADQGWL